MSGVAIRNEQGGDNDSQRVFSDTMRALTLALGLDDIRKHGHAWRVALLAEALAQVHGHPEPALLFHAGLLHDIGAVGIAHCFGHQPALALASQEARLHPHRGQALLRASALLRPLADIVADHHKRVDEHPPDRVRDAISHESSILQLAEQLELSMRDRPADVIAHLARACAKNARGTVCYASVCDAALDMVEVGGAWLTHLFTSATRSELTARVPVWLDLSGYSTRRLLDELLWTFPRVIDAKHRHTMGHSTRVALFGFRIAEAIGHATIDRWDVLWAGLLHDVGKIGIPGRILDRPKRLTFDDYEALKHHARHTETILQEITALQHIAQPAAAHHERYDGKGYPHAMAGEEIPLIGRILGIADLYDTLTNRQAFRTELTHREAMDFLKRQTGRSIDPHIAPDAFKVLDYIAAAPQCVDTMVDQVQATIRDEGDAEDVLHFVSTMQTPVVLDNRGGGPAIPVQWRRVQCTVGLEVTEGLVALWELSDKVSTNHLLDFIDAADVKKLETQLRGLTFNEPRSNYFCAISGIPLELITTRHANGYDILWREAEDRIQFVRRLSLFYRNYVSTAEAVMFADSDGVISDVNQAFLDLYGYERHEVIGKTPRILKSGCHPPAFYEEMWSHITHPKIGAWHGEIINCRKDGEHVYVFVRIDVLRDANGSTVGFLSHAANITERRLAEQALQEKDRKLEAQNDQLTALNRLKSDLIAVTSHDMKAPLAAMINYALLAGKCLERQQAREDGPNSQTQQAADYVRKVVSSGYDLVRFIHLILNMEKIHSGGLLIDRRRVYVDKVLERCVEMFRMTAGQTVEIRYQHTGVSRPLLADATRLEQVFNNLLSNAVKYSQEGAAVDVHYRDLAEDTVEVTVTDRGPGIPEHAAEMIFERYTQLDHDASPQSSVGLGLYISRQIVEQHGGTIRARNREGGGARFDVSLPAEFGEGEDTVALLIEPEPSRRQEICEPLQARQALCLIADNIDAGQRLLRYANPALLFLNAQLWNRVGCSDEVWTQPVLRTLVAEGDIPALKPGFDYALASPVLAVEVEELLHEALLRARKQTNQDDSRPAPEALASQPTRTKENE